MKQILLTFDVEEFDTPLEYDATLPLHEQIRVSVEGTRIILDALQAEHIPATFFCTAVFASHASDIITRICTEGHEVASHGYFHSKWQNTHLSESKKELERISGNKVEGFRMARMMPIDEKEIERAGYRYNSSLNPIYLPGRYNNLFKPRTLYASNGVFHVPASASPVIRVPLFWLSFHNLPLWFYKSLVRWTINTDKYVNIYFHPWEFTDLSKPEYRLPKIITRNSGVKMLERFSELILWMKKWNYQFITLGDFVRQHASL